MSMKTIDLVITLLGVSLVSFIPLSLAITGCETNRQFAERLQNQAVRHGAAEWFIDDKDQRVFRWKNEVASE